MLDLLNIQHDSNAMASEAKRTLRNWINENIPAAITELAERAGHKVVFTPPRYSDLQRIELVWARVKGAVARAYSRDTTLEDVKALLYYQSHLLCTSEGKLAIKNFMKHLDSVICSHLNEMNLVEVLEIADEVHEDNTSSLSRFSNVNIDSFMIHECDQ